MYEELTPEELAQLEIEYEKYLQEFEELQWFNYAASTYF